jgi:TRAP transporter TAXI family solute receptor
MTVRTACACLLLGVFALVQSPSAKAQQFINILTGGTAGVYYPLGVALSKIYADKIPKSRPTVQATQASVQNLQLLQEGKGEIGFTLGDSLQFAWDGEAEAGFKAPLKRLRGIAAIYPNYIQLVATRESGVKTISDLKGHSLSVGAARSGTELNTRAILKAAGLNYQDLSKVEYLPFAESVELMKNRQLDATLQSAGLGVASIRDLATNNDITVVAVQAALVLKIGAPYIPVTIPANTYRGQSGDVPTAAVGNFLVTHERASNDLVYQLTKSMYQNLPTMVASHSAARDIKIENALIGMAIPLHPGAERFYKEMGLIK